VNSDYTSYILQNQQLTNSEVSIGFGWWDKTKHGLPTW